MLGFTVHVQNASKLNRQQIQQFLHYSEEIRFKDKGRAEIYGWVPRASPARLQPPEPRRLRKCCAGFVHVSPEALKVDREIDLRPRYAKVDERIPLCPTGC